VISEDVVPKIIELKRLLARHPVSNPDMIIQCAKHFAMMGDNSFLEEKLAFFRSADMLMHSNVDALRQQQQQQQPGQDSFVA
jgi:hypothetical protein